MNDTAVVPGEVQDIVDQAQQTFGRLARQIHILDLAHPQFGVAQQIEQAEHAIHGRAQFVGDVGGKFTLQPRRFHGDVPRVVQLALAAFEFVHHRVERLLHGQDIGVTGLQIGARTEISVLGQAHRPGESFQGRGHAPCHRGQKHQQQRCTHSGNDQDAQQNRGGQLALGALVQRHGDRAQHLWTVGLCVLAPQRPVRGSFRQHRNAENPAFRRLALEMAVARRSVGVGKPGTGGIPIQDGARRGADLQHLGIGKS